MLRYEIGGTAKMLLWRTKVNTHIGVSGHSRGWDAGQCSLRGDRGGRMKVRAKWVEGMSFVGESETGHTVVIDGAPEYGGRNLGMRPMEMVLMGAAACTAFDVVLILRKARQPIADCAVEADAERADADPKVFTRIHLKYTIAGRGLDPGTVERAVKLSKDKYCSATLMLAKTAEITFEIAIVDGDRLPAPAR